MRAYDEMSAKRLTGQDPEIRLEAESFNKLHPSRQPRWRRFVAPSEATSVSLRCSEPATMVSRHRISLWQQRLAGNTASGHEAPAESGRRGSLATGNALLYATSAVRIRQHRYVGGSRGEVDIPPSLSFSKIAFVIQMGFVGGKLRRLGLQGWNMKDQRMLMTKG
ncbi:hypothetical protein BDP81DRAFT_443494 [Colletotrichum phormii]|uniref:Uncharacterized protein n=1 Tax=Colletotrichum phormii TaxID=359342 RepID=A0AAI9ZBK0_9PEZI|nr:uncharacterized protein BDP81DRAFT_443494 [Colletotrichum phormii]KAK1621503.1 hypothetical protein BDP81DRAFT_443494 [Colletotrichum phormii]